MDENMTEALDLSLPKKEAASEHSDVTHQGVFTFNDRTEVFEDDTAIPDDSYNSTDSSVKSTEQYERHYNNIKNKKKIVCGTKRSSDSLRSLSPTGSDQSSSSKQKSPDTYYDITSGPTAFQRTSNGVTLCLHDAALWGSFAKCGTEMIINRGGRRMFPHIVLSATGLDPDAMYSITLEIVPADNRRYKFVNNTWAAMGMADPSPDIQEVAHPDSPNTGAFWTENRASFSKVRLTNNKDATNTDSTDENVLLLSMHKYKAVVKIRNNSVTPNTWMPFDFEETTFIAVTAYQNNQITKLKIMNNPFAKAFRDIPHSGYSRPAHVSRRKEARPKYETDAKETAFCPSFPSLSGQPLNPWYFPLTSTSVRPHPSHMPTYSQLCQGGMNMDTTTFNQIPYIPWMNMTHQLPLTKADDRSSLQYNLPFPSHMLSPAVQSLLMSLDNAALCYTRGNSTEIPASGCSTEPTSASALLDPGSPNSGSESVDV